MAQSGRTMRYPVDIGQCVKTQGFGDNPQSYSRFGLQGHNGDDWANSYGGPIYAVDFGEIAVVSYEANGYGHYVKIRHAWGMTLYAHLRKRTSRNIGEKVIPGDVIGEMGTTGNSTGIHLHFGVYPEGVSRNNGYSGADDPTEWYARFPINATKEPAPEPGPEPKEFPKLPRARVISVIGLNVRQAAGTSYPKSGWLANGTTVDVMRGVCDGADTWVQIGYQQWIAMEHGGVRLAVWVEA